MAAGETPVFANANGVNGFDVSESEGDDEMEVDDDGEDGKNTKRAKKAKPIKRKEPRRKPLSPAKKAATSKTIKPKKARSAEAKNTPKTKKAPAASKGPKPPNWRLKENLKVDVRHEDPFFEAKRAPAPILPFPFVSSVAHSKLLFNAVHNGDAAFLKRVCEDVKHVHTLKVDIICCSHRTCLGLISE